LTHDRRLRQASVLGPGVDPSHGYAFAAALTDAICHVVAETPLVHDGLDLGPAVQRALFIDLVNRPSLYAAFASSGSNVVVANRVEAEVVRLMLPSARIELVARSPGIEAAASVGRRLRRPSAGAVGRGSVLFAALHPKFRRFVAPLAERLDAVVVDDLSGRPPLRSAAALRAYPEILGTVEGAERALAESGARVVVAVEGNAPPDAVLAAVAARVGVRTVVLQQGWSPQIHAGFRGLPFERMLVWGEGFADALSAFNPGVSFQVVGSHAIGSTAAAEPDAVGVFLQSTSHLIAPEHVEQLVQLAAELAAEVPRVLVREHPGAPLTADARRRLDGAELANAPEVALSEVLARCHHTLSIYSTTLLESVATGAVPVSFNPTSLPRLEPSIAEHAVGFETPDVSAAKEAVVAGTTTVEARARFAVRYFPLVGEAAASRAVAAIGSLAERQ
jgi:hypothetical protein